MRSGWVIRYLPTYSLLLPAPTPVFWRGGEGEGEGVLPSIRAFQLPEASWKSEDACEKTSVNVNVHVHGVGDTGLILVGADMTRRMRPVLFM